MNGEIRVSSRVIRTPGSALQATWHTHKNLIPIPLYINRTHALMGIKANRRPKINVFLVSIKYSNVYPGVIQSTPSRSRNSVCKTHWIPFSFLMYSYLLNKSNFFISRFQYKRIVIWKSCNSIVGFRIIRFRTEIDKSKNWIQHPFKSIEFTFSENLWIIPHLFERFR